MADNLETAVKIVVTGMIAKSELFTALDVSNKVKETFPDARHRDIAPIVRKLYTDAEMGDYERTTIQVKLLDGSTPDAHLYHPVGDTWDLDTKYDDARRTQTARVPSRYVPPPPLPPVNNAADVVNEIKAGLADIDAGKTFSHNEVIEELKTKYKAPVKINPASVLPPSVWDGMFSKFKKKFSL